VPRDIPVGNGALYACFDAEYALRDLYFPHVGQENHLCGAPSRIGVWVDGAFSWVGAGWKRDLGYLRQTLVTDVNLFHEGLGLLLSAHDAVDFHENVLVRELTVENLRPGRREVRLFFGQNFSISGNDVGDTAAFDPVSGGIVHYKGSRYFLASGRGAGGGGPAQYAVGQKGVQGREGTWRDAEDGLLSGNPIAQGSVDSVIGLALVLEGHATGTVHAWIAAGETWEKVRAIDAIVRAKHPETFVDRTSDYWRLWVRKEPLPRDGLPDAVTELYARSLLVLQLHGDWQGGIVAANDSDVVLYNRDTYSYVWPRDGALAAQAFDSAGYPFTAQLFYGFAARAIGREGCLLHKYNPDGTLASSWHPWFERGRAQLPIQEDGTALVLWALWHHFVRYRDIDFIKPLYKPLIKTAADFLCSFTDPATGLPAASYDLWEERRGTFSFTVGAVFGGLTAAALFCRVFGESEREQRYFQCATAIREASSKHLWREELGRFCRGIAATGDAAGAVDGTLDASLWGLFAFGLYEADDPRVQATMRALRDGLWVRGGVGGMARYDGDGYHRADGGVPGNPWVICTLWLADWLARIADSDAKLDEAVTLLAWAQRHALPSGVLPEQVDPGSGKPLSVSPLAWSHATYVATVRRVARRRAALRARPGCGLGELAAAEADADDWLGRLYDQMCKDIHDACKTA